MYQLGGFAHKNHTVFLSNPRAKSCTDPGGSMVASGSDENSPAVDAVAAQVVVVDDATKVVHEAVVGEKRPREEEVVDPLVASVETVVAEAPGAVDDTTASQDSQATQDEDIHDVMAKMKEAAGADVAFDAAAAAAAVVPPPPEALKADSATPVQDAVVAAAAAGVGADPNAVANVKFDSKRMARVSFNSWFDFDSYFEMYMQETFQPFRMRSSCSVEAYRRNQQKVMLNNKSSRGRRAEFPDEAIHHHRIYMCTHAMKARCRGANTRPGQKYRGIGCMAKINVKITPADNPSKYMVIVTDQVCLVDDLPNLIMDINSFRCCCCRLCRTITR